MKSILLLAILSVVSGSNVDQKNKSDTIIRHDYKQTFKFPFFYPNSSTTIPYFDTSDTVIKTTKSIRLTPSVPHVSGSIWAHNPIGYSNWETEFSFTAFGRGYMGGRGLAFWYTRHHKPASTHYFGNENTWAGFGLVFDTADQEEQRYTPVVYGILNDGSKSFEKRKDYGSFSIGSCFRDYRNSPGPVWVRVIYNRKKLSVEIDLRQSGYGYYTCFEKENVELPTGYYLGLSAETGDLADDHDILSFETYEYDAAKRTDLPDRPYQKEHEKKRDFNFDQHTKDKIKKVEKKVKDAKNKKGEPEGYQESINPHTISQIQENQFKIIEALNVIQQQLLIPKTGHESKHDASRSEDLSHLRNEMGSLTDNVRELTSIVHEALSKILTPDTNEGESLRRYVDSHMSHLNKKLDESKEELKKTSDTLKETAERVDVKTGWMTYLLYFVFFLVGIILMNVVRVLRKGSQQSKKYI